MHELINKITVNSLYEAKNKIYELLIKQYSPKEISQIEFIIQGISRRHNLSQISEIKKEFENKHNKEDEDKDPRTAFFFKQFDKGKTVKDVVKETDYKLEIVQKAYGEFLKLEEKTVVPKWFLDDLKEDEIRFERHYDPNFVYDDSEMGLHGITMSLHTFVENAVNE